MKRYSEQDITKTRELRRATAYSFIQLERITGIPQTTIRNWCHDDSVHTKWDTLRATNERKRQEFKKTEIGVLTRITNIDTQLAKILVAIIYWCEGAKYPATNRLAIANSDVELLRVFILLLRIAFPIDESKFSVHLQIHTTHDYEKLKKYWSDQLGIPTTQFIRPTVTSPNGKKHRSSYSGTCTLKYMDYSLQLKLIGLYEALAEKLIT